MKLYSEVFTSYAILLALYRWCRTRISDVDYDVLGQASLLITIAYQPDFSSSTILFVILTLTAICGHSSALFVQSDANGRHIRISPEYLTCQSHLPNRYFHAARDMDDSDLDRKSGHGGRPIDAIGLKMQTPNNS
jgi:hypothetical protein